MYNTTTRRYTLADHAGSYAWMWGDDLSPFRYLSEKQLKESCALYASLEIDHDIRKIEEDSHNLIFPRYGYTTAQVFQNRGEYLRYKCAEIKTDIRADIDNAIAWLKDKIAQQSKVSYPCHLVIPAPYGASLTILYKLRVGPRGGRYWDEYHRFTSTGVSLPQFTLQPGQYKLTQWRNGFPHIIEHFDMDLQGEITDLRD